MDYNREILKNPMKGCAIIISFFLRRFLYNISHLPWKIHHIMSIAQKYLIK